MHAIKTIHEADRIAKKLGFVRGKGTYNGAPYWRDNLGRIVTRDRLAELAGLADATINPIESGTFAEACCNQNSIADLEAALYAPADPVDMETWGLTAEEWREQIKLALAAKRAELAGLA